jgi:hypothetical protein
LLRGAAIIAVVAARLRRVMGAAHKSVLRMMT